MKKMTTFEIIQIILGTLTLLGAFYIGVTQNKINDRLRALQDYVAISAVPDMRSGKINLINVGKTTLYLWGFDMPGNRQRFEKARLISAGTNDASYYWIDPPYNLDTVVSFPHQFEFSLYLEDEFGQKWISENGGLAEKVKIKNSEGKEVDAIGVKVWSYKTYKNNWKF